MKVILYRDKQLNKEWRVYPFQTPDSDIWHGDVHYIRIYVENDTVFVGENATYKVGTAYGAYCMTSGWERVTEIVSALERNRMATIPVNESVVEAQS